MSDFRHKGQKTRFNFLDKDCIGRECWAPGMYQPSTHPAPKAPGRDKPVTICIGLLCDQGKHILLAADMRGSYGTVTSNDQMAKLFDLPAKHYAAMAGSGSYCTDIIAELYHRMEQVSSSEIAPQVVRKCIEESYLKIQVDAANEALLGNLKITLERLLTDKTLVPKIRREAKEIVNSVPIKGALIVAGFYKGQPVQFIAEPDYDNPTLLKTRVEITRGNAVIGSGASAALFWLNYRKQNLALGLAHSLLHLTEAKQFSETDAHVGPYRQVVLLWPGDNKPLHWTPEAHALVEAWWHRYGLMLSDSLESDIHNEAVRKTFGLPMPSASQTSTSKP